MAAVVLNNRYRVVRELGQGGFGRTFLAVDTHLPSERSCVIKQLYPIVSKPKQYQWVRERFQREAAILETLSRGNSQIPQLYAYFAEAETFYLVQEYIEGKTLTEKVAHNGVMSEQEVKKILMSLLQVLAYVHDQRIIHRDVKPDNIILRAGDHKPVLIDFGVVKEALETVVDSDRTHSIAIGTPGYMPSEQAAGRPVYSSDLYSLGLTAVFLLSGQPPQNLESDPKTGELLWRKAVPHLHGQLARVIDQAIRFHPRDRFADANSMLSALTTNEAESTRTQKPEHNQETGNATSYPTVAAVSPTGTVSKGNGNNILIGSAIALLLILSAGFVGYGTVQILENLRRSSDQDSVATEPTNPQETSPPESNQPKEEPKKEDKVSPPSPQVETPPLNLDLNSPVVVVPTVPVKETPSPPPSPTPPTPQLTGEDVPIFSTGVKKQEVLKTLGEPTSIRRGYWENTQSVLYKNYIPDQLDLGLIFDRDTEKLRQTEASFSSSVELSMIEAALTQMLQGQITPEIREALVQVYRQQTDLRSFAIADWEGMIQRQQGNQIYIGVWEKELH
ncbi:serine/threonine-protein kinase [Halothece sp. PCC 7418]|uniref:serine/threonine-protein kinase n=1 Tax=Halothece sp. (strain PCC 7418) TaxID=65093 RepID=UPI0005A256E4|nr:serine/threonine-protein kinase [Halothece sp. PCC 7418]